MILQPPITYSFHCIKLTLTNLMPYNGHQTSSEFLADVKIPYHLIIESS